MAKIAVVGAGINGACCAYMLQRAGFDVTVFEATTIAGGGSGAAGAFLSPKFVKTGLLKELINTALDEAFAFYKTTAKEYINFYPLLHIAKDQKDAQHLAYVKDHDNIELLKNPPFIPSNEYIYTSKSGIVAAKEMIETLLETIDVVYEKIDTVEKKEKRWCLNKKYSFDKVILATGAYTNLVNELYLEGVIRGIWGHRIDVKTSTKNDISIHQFVSISAVRDGICSIGATHDVHYKPGMLYDKEKAREELLQKAFMTLPLKNVKVIKDYMGFRCGSSDYIPLIGEVVDATTSLKLLSRRTLEQKKQDFSTYSYHKGLYLINGSAGYGFVLAPYLAKRLVQTIIDDTFVPQEIALARFFPRYVRRKF